jgi:hypothetical protein
MLRVGFLVAVLMPLGACTLWFGDGDGDDQCKAVPATDLGGGQDIAPAPLRDPSDLTCDQYGGYYCDPSCGPCPDYADLAPIPTYGYCGDICETFNESQCESAPQCRVVLDAECTLGTADCFTSFMGCFPTDTQQDNSVNCWNADAWTCSRSNACTAYHSTQGCSGDANCEPVRPFELCAPEGADPGSCTNEVVACDALPPSCPANTRPGVANGCWTGACIPSRYCGAL